ncbi:MAG TPA: energy transducer TonB [Parvibaculum sp.]
MSPAAIGIANRDVQDDCSSVLSVRSRGLQLSMAASLAAHVAAAATIMSMMPVETMSLGDPNALEVAFVDLAPAALSPKTIVAKVQPKPINEQKSDAIAKPIKLKPLPAVDHAELVMKAAAKAKAEAPKVAAEAQTLPQSSPVSPGALASHEPQAYGAKPAPAAKAGAEDRDDFIVTTARFRVPPTPAKYPKRAHDLNQQGEALIRARIDYEGNTAEVLVWKSSGFVLLDNAALSAVRRWQFMPERRNGTPVVAWVEIPVRFRLN